MKEVIGRNVSYRQEEIEIIFQDIFSSFSFDDVTCQRMKSFLWKQHKEKKKQHNSLRDNLQQRQRDLDEFIQTAYEDKLSGAISEEMWSKNNDKWVREHERIADQIKSLNDSTEEYMTKGISVIELMQSAEITFKSSTAEKRRRMVEKVSSNLLLGDGSIEYHWKEPFKQLAIKGEIEKWCLRGDLNSHAREGGGF